MAVAQYGEVLCVLRCDAVATGRRDCIICWFNDQERARGSGTRFIAVGTCCLQMKLGRWKVSNKWGGGTYR